MPPDVLVHIIEMTDARPCGHDRHMGHCPRHGSKKNRDFSICRTEDRILLHCFAGCSAHEIVSALGLTLADLFDDAPLPHGSRPTPKPPRVNRRRIAFALELHGIMLHNRARAVLASASGLNCSQWTAADFDAAMDAVAKAHSELERAGVLFAVADSQREKAYLEAR